MGKFDTDIKLAREMSLFDATLIGVGAMIGAGIFVLIGIAAGVAGPALLVVFVLNGLIATLTAISYAELGSCYHDAGGGYLWVKEGLPKWNGFLSGWMSWFAHAVACSLYALGFSAYFGHLLHEFSVQLPQWGFLSPQKVLAGATAMLFAYINYRGASETGKIGNFVTVAKIIILLIFCAFGIEVMLNSSDPFGHFRDFAPHGIGGVFKAMGLTFIAFQGFEVIAQSSEEIRNPRKNIPRAVFLSLIIVVPIYIVVTIVAIGTVQSGNMTPWDYLAAKKEIALVEVAKNFFVGGGVMILVAGLISTISALNATIYSSSRVAYAMGRDRNFPGFFGKVHPKRRTPHWSILISAIIIVGMALSLPIEDVASAADIMFLLLFLQVNIAMIRLRKKRPDLDRGFKVPLFPILTIIAIASLLFLAIYMLNYSLTAWIVTGVWVGLGLVVYKVYASSREIEHARKLITLSHLSKKEYSILVHLVEEEESQGLVSLALALGEANKAQVTFLKVVEIPEGKRARLEDGSSAAADPGLAAAVERAEAAGVPSKALIRIAHRAALCVLETAREEDCNLILVARPRGRGLLGRVHAAVVDSTLRVATSELASLSGRLDNLSPKRITIIVGDDAHSRLALDIALSLCRIFGGKPSIALATEDEGDVLLRRRRLAEISTVLAEAGYTEGSVHIFGIADPAHLIRSTASTDLLVMGRVVGGFLESLIANTPQGEIGESATCPVLGLSEYQETQSLFTVLFSRERRKGAPSGN